MNNIPEEKRYAQKDFESFFECYGCRFRVGGLDSDPDFYFHGEGYPEMGHALHSPWKHPGFYSHPAEAKGTLKWMPLRVFNAQKTLIYRRCFLMDDHKKTGKKKSSSAGLPIGMCIGIAIGAAVGAATNNLGTWLPIGLCLGFALAPALGQKKDDHENGPDDKQ